MITDIDIEEIKKAKQLLENPNFFMDLANFAGKPIEIFFSSLPAKSGNILAKTLDKSLWWTLEASIASIDCDDCKDASINSHKFMSCVSGGIGGLFGFLTIFAELPISTGIIFRSIVDIARSEGEDINLHATKIECLQVFALSSPTKSSDDGSETGYYATRLGMSHVVHEALVYVSKEGSKKVAKEISTKSIPSLVKLIEKIALRFNVVISNKILGQVLPLIGAVGGAS